MRITKKKIVGVVAATAVVALGASSAYAYFTAGGSGAGGGTVGVSAPWTFAFVSSTGGPLYPGSGSQVFTYTITNSSDGPVNLANIAGGIADVGGAAVSFSTGNPIPGCESIAFHAPTSNYATGIVAGHASENFDVTLTMDDLGHPQDACQNADPKFTFTAS